VDKKQPGNDFHNLSITLGKGIFLILAVSDVLITWQAVIAELSRL